MPMLSFLLVRENLINVFFSTTLNLFERGKFSFFLANGFSNTSVHLRHHVDLGPKLHTPGIRMSLLTVLSVPYVTHFNTDSMTEWR